MEQQSKLDEAYDNLMVDIASRRARIEALHDEILGFEAELDLIQAERSELEDAINVLMVGRRKRQKAEASA